MARDRAGWERSAAALRIEGRAFINGRHVAARSGRSFDDISPIDGKVIGQVARCEAADIDAAVAAARATFESGVWRRTEPRERKRIL
jgi:acyl-CoA reductase-like NAD-dependent aldehyde dehydrogenase